MGHTGALAEGGYQTFEVMDNSDLRSADLLVDRSAIEIQATYLIAKRGDPEIGYKTEHTYQTDARTALFEALTASGHLSKVELSGSLDDIHRTMLNVHLNAYSDTLPEHEKARQYQELCEELTRQKVESLQADGEAPADLQVATISDDPSSAGMSDEEAQELGYRPQNHKGMVRSSRLIIQPDGSYTRVTEQVSRSNSDAITSAQFFAANNIPTRAHSQADVRVLGSQLLHDMSEGVAGLQRRLDTFSGEGIRYGEQKNDKQISYELLAQESAAREAQAEVYISTLSDYMMRLDTLEASGEISKNQHTELLKTEIHRILQSICVMSPDYAVDCFGPEAAPGYYQASDRAMAGDISGSANIIVRNQANEQTVSLCGMSITNQKAKELGAEVDSLGRLIQLGLERWGTKIGACRVPECISSKPTEVGPCDVCTGGCEPLFNRGWSLSKITSYYRSLRKQSGQLTKKSVTIWDIFKSKPSTKKQNMRR